MQTHDIPLPSLSYVSRSEPTTPGYPPTDLSLSPNQDGTISAFQLNDTGLTGLQPSTAAESDPLRTSLLLRPEETPSKKSGKQRNSGSISPRKRGMIIGGEPISRIYSDDPSNSRTSAEVWNRRPVSPTRDYHRSTSRPSPLGFLQQLSSSLHIGGNHRHVVPSEPFVPVNPFESNWRHLPCCLSSPYDLEQGDDEFRAPFGCDCEDVLPLGTLRSRLHSLRHLFVTLCRETYLIFLLRLPAMYFSRVARIFQDAEISRPDIERMINTGNGDARFFSARIRNVPTISVDLKGATAATTTTAGDVGRVDVAAASVLYTPLPFPEEWTPESASPALFRFKHSWESFVDSLIREWKTLNVVSALLASAILTIFQLPDVANDPVTRTGVLLSLICALMSLSYGCMYIVRFGQMRSMLRASRWAEEASKTKTSIFWNVWVLLATPAIWLAWATLWFIAVILSFVWRTGSVNDPSPRPPASATAALIVRVCITAIIGLGLVYMVLIVMTLKTYGSRPRSNSEAQSDVEMQKMKQSKGKDDDEMDRRGRQRACSRSVR